PSKVSVGGPHSPGPLGPAARPERGRKRSEPVSILPNQGKRKAFSLQIPLCRPEFTPCIFKESYIHCMLLPPKGWRMTRIVISQNIRANLAAAHDVGEPEVHQCFANRTGSLLVDSRETHRTDPPTRWFIAPTNKGRLLKVCYVPN